MTTPAQLKYLDAMEIPVWVSRDLVVEESILLKPELAASNIQANNDQSVTHQAFKQGAQKSNHSAQSILDSLASGSEQSAQKNTVNIQRGSTKLSLDNAVAVSVNSAKLTDEVNSGEVFPTAQTIDNENLLFNSPLYYVYASGSKHATWMVVGHSPEPFTGIENEPFAGEAGELLNNMLRAAGIEQPRTQAYLVNVVNGIQSADINAEAQLELKQKLFSVIDEVKPKVLLFVGQIAAQNLLGIKDPLIIMRSKVHTVGNNNIPCVVTYYPSYLLQKPIDKRKTWNDLKLAMSQLNQS